MKKSIYLSAPPAMQPNIETQAESIQQIPQKNKLDFDSVSLVAFTAIGVIVFVVLCARADLRIRNIKARYFQKRRDVAQRFNAARYSLYAQRQDTSPVHVPVTNNEIRDRRKIVRLNP